MGDGSAADAAYVSDEQIAGVGRLLDAYFAGYPARHCAQEEPGEAGVPPAMFAGPVADDGWVDWKMVASPLGRDDVRAIEAEFGVAFPPLLRAFLLARCHLFTHAGGRAHDESILMPTAPSDAPLAPLRDELVAWRALIDAGYVPFAEWGDGYGPVCLDARGRADDGDGPVGWFDHEILHTLGIDACRDRATLAPHWRPLYPSFRAFLHDVFGHRGEVIP